MTEWWLCTEVHPRVWGPQLTGMGLGQEYAIAPAYPEQFAFLSVEAVHGGGEEGCVPEPCSYRYAGFSKGTGSRAQMLGSVPKPIG